MAKGKKLQIRNSTAEFLIFTNQNKTSKIEVRYEDETIWLSQKLMAALFDVEVNTINYHIKEIYKSGEIQEEGTIRKFGIVQIEGKREVNRDVDFYNLDAIISVGYRVNSKRATQFRQWATQVLKEYAIKGYVLDRKRMENGAFLIIKEDTPKVIDSTPIVSSLRGSFKASEDFDYKKELSKALSEKYL